MWSEECQHPPLTCVHDMVDRCPLWYAVYILCYGGWCRFVCICTCTYVDYSGWQTPPPPHTHKICTLLLHYACCIHFVSSPIATMTILSMRQCITFIKSTDIGGMFPSVCLQCIYTLDSPTSPTSQQPMLLPPEQPTMWSLGSSSASKVHSARWPY